MGEEELGGRIEIGVGGIEGRKGAKAERAIPTRAGGRQKARDDVRGDPWPGRSVQRRTREAKYPISAKPQKRILRTIKDCGMPGVKKNDPTRTARCYAERG